MRGAGVRKRCTECVRRLGEEDGQVLFEYALILALVAVVTIGVLTSLGQSVSGLLQHVSSSMSSVTNP
jgi:pilus assembly protein Flp/PilA